MLIDFKIQMIMPRTSRIKVCPACRTLVTARQILRDTQLCLANAA
ncbi:hypothetical protein SAMN05444955_105161 [Lihuaxuella thermophila]|uniref:Uncharacterized protein n=1 Tax=Lihuaxuella thermophila TaxID=1173111 RepID=A0A1H8DFQ7_9BACL|nr:hypothetical protein SAMN05444955_105161 [Lihuaxuella thermophila]